MQREVSVSELHLQLGSYYYKQRTVEVRNPLYTKDTKHCNISPTEMSLWIEALATAISSSFSKEATPSSPSATQEQKLVYV